MLKIFLTLFAISTSAFAAEPARVTAKFNVKQSGNKVTIEAIAVPASGLVINHDGPWKLVVDKTEGFTAANKSSTSFSDKIPGVSLEATSDGKSKKIAFDYEFVTFVCTANKSMCYREKLKGKHST